MNEATSNISQDNLVTKNTPSEITTDQLNQNSGNYNFLNNKMKWLFGVMFTALLAVSTFTYFKNIEETETLHTTKTTQDNVQETTTREGNLLEKDLIYLNNFTNDSSVENQDKYLQNVTKTLQNTNLTEQEKNTLLLRKAIVTSVLRGSKNQDKYTKESFSILNNFISTESTKPADTQLKDYSLIALTKLHVQCCFEDALKENSLESEIYRHFNTDLGYNDFVSKWLTLRELTKMLSKERSNDLATVSQAVDINAVILDSFQEKINLPLRKEILKELGGQLSSFDKLQQKTFSDFSNVNLQPIIHHAYGYDIYHSLNLTTGKSLDSKTNNLIDQNYDKSLVVLNNTGSYKNYITINTQKFYTLINYIYSLDRRYGNSVDKEKFDSLVKELIKSINYSKETQSMANTYFRDSVFGETSLDPSRKKERFFISLSKTNKEVADYSDSIGIKITDIK